MKTNGERNIGVVHGEWGENVAAERLRCEGMQIIERNSRPLATDRRLEIDIIAYDPERDVIVFVEVKQHSTHLRDESRIRGVDMRKKRNLRTAFAAWRRVNKWEGDCRFDVVEVFGVPGTRRPHVDHIQHVYLSTGL